MKLLEFFFTVADGQFRHSKYLMVGGTDRGKNNIKAEHVEHAKLGCLGGHAPRKMLETNR